MRIILIGFGTVAQSLVRIISSDKERLVKEYGFDPRITAIVDSRGMCADDTGLDLSLALKVKKEYGTVGKYPGAGSARANSSRIISESEAEVMVESTPTNFKDGEPGLSNIKKALASGKHVVTVNKGPLALAMHALLELARHRKLQLRFGGTVGGGTPYLNFASRSLAGEKIREIRGILNGTTNYILTQMQEESLSFQKALKQAQEKGYAEKDPANDIDGYDTAAKIVIMANWIMNLHTNISDVKVTGISKVTSESLKSARDQGSRIKLIGRATESSATVRPEEISATDPLCVPGTLNAVAFSTAHAGEITLIGQGAGGEQTSSAIIRDLVDIRSKYSI